MNPSNRAAIALADSSVAAKATEHLLGDAVASGAEILHLEPYAGKARVRYRIDGMLRDWGRFSHHALNALLAHLKHRADLLIDENRWSQEGDFTLALNGTVYKIKLTTLPLDKGEKAVLRIFNAHTPTHSLAELGIWGDTRKRLNRTLTATHGLFVVSGPARSGVSTTLTSLVSSLNRPHHSTVSIDDMPKQPFGNIQQLRTDVRRGHNLLHHLEAALHGDSDSIIVGNLHGKQATNAVLEATTHGRIILAGLHAPTMASALTRLQEAATEHYLLAHNLQALLHQQLVRRLCDNCKIPAKPDAVMLRQITSRTHITVATLQHFIDEVATHQQTPQMQLFSANPKGCHLCAGTGFKGQIGLFELVTPTAETRQRLSSHTHAATLLHHSVKKGMMPLIIDGFVKALSGLTTIDEVLHSRF